ncbi:hypothetical protein [Geomicrobium sp. JCM 19038]|uniref:hypothetical protein n=1 Tax=Geomicrobium sp. JCM 19038 TaxID=1460635 RepID=UPI00045F3E0D|nr:hypothetical protein [Geomicrobium sp. JCM 19038]GAK08130.1 permease [Geomicrobium sp. JCM 19038]
MSKFFYFTHAKRLGNRQVISWALLIGFPFMLVITLIIFSSSMMELQVETYSLFYVLFFSMYIGFVFWYQGLALGGVA